MKLVHTSDVHLDMCFSAYRMPAEFGNRRRQRLKDVFRTIVSRAGDWPADALLIAGDLFDLDRLSRDTIGLMLQEFRSIPHVPIFISPGTADPYVPHSPYATETWPKNVHVFRRPEWESVTIKDGALTVHGFAHEGRELNAAAWGRLSIPETDRGHVHIALGFGCERNHQPAESSRVAQFEANSAAAAGLDYVAMGYSHAAAPVQNAAGVIMWYSGSPEGHSQREQGMHHYLEIEAAKGRIEVKQVPSARVIYATRRIECDAFGSAQELVDEVRAIARGEQERQVARVVLTGNLDPAIHGELGLVFDAAALEFEHLQLVDKTAPLEDYEALANEDTSLGAFVNRLNREIAAAEDEGQRQKCLRAIEVGVASFRQRDVEIRGLERG